MAADAEAKMHDDTPGEAEAFLQRWRVSKYMLIKEGLVPVDPQTMIRQMQAAQTPGVPLSPEVLEIARKYCDIGYTKECHTFMYKRVSPSVFQFIKTRKPEPRTIDEMIGCVDEWVESHKRFKGKTSSHRISALEAWVSEQGDQSTRDAEDARLIQLFENHHPPLPPHLCHTGDSVPLPHPPQHF